MLQIKTPPKWFHSFVINEFLAPLNRIIDHSTTFKANLVQYLSRNESTKILYCCARQSFLRRWAEGKPRKIPASSDNIGLEKFRIHLLPWWNAGNDQQHAFLVKHDIVLLFGSFVLMAVFYLGEKFKLFWRKLSLHSEYLKKLSLLFIFLF